MSYDENPYEHDYRIAGAEISNDEIDRLRQINAELMEALRITRDHYLEILHDEYDGAWPESAFADATGAADAAIAKAEGRDA